MKERNNRWKWKRRRLSHQYLDNYSCGSICLCCIIVHRNAWKSFMWEIYMTGYLLHPAAFLEYGGFKSIDDRSLILSFILLVYVLAVWGRDLLERETHLYRCGEIPTSSYTSWLLLLSWRFFQVEFRHFHIRLQMFKGAHVHLWWTISKPS